MKSRITANYNQNHQIIQFTTYKKVNIKPKIKNVHILIKRRIAKLNFFKYEIFQYVSDLQ